jgi:hypothetical protein
VILPCSTWRSIASCAVCDVVAIRVDDIAPNGYALDRATVRQIAEKIDI